MLNASGSGSASYTSVLIVPVGVRTISGNLPDQSLLALNGADNVTIDGLEVVHFGRIVGGIWYGDQDS